MRPLLDSIDVTDDLFLNSNSALQDFVDANGLPVDITEYFWGGYAKKRNTAVRATKLGVLHHSRGKHAQLLSRQAQCPTFQTACLQGSGCCPNTTFCCLGIAQGTCCNPGQICTGVKTCCDQNQIGCGEACCNSGQECCGIQCCNTSNGFQCTTDNKCVAVPTNSTSSIASVTRSSLSSLSSPSTRTRTSSTTSTTGDLFDTLMDNNKSTLSKITTIVGAIAGISIALGVVVYLTRRNRQRRRLAEIQRTAQAQNFQPQPPPNFVTEPTHQMARTPWPQPTQALLNSSRMPLYYADNTNMVNMPSLHNHQQPYYASQLSRKPTTATNSEFSSTYGGSSEYHAQPWAVPISTQPQPVNALPTHTPWTQGLNTPGSWSGRVSGTEAGRQNTKAQYITAAQREEATWEAKRREAQAAGTSGVGASNANVNMIVSNSGGADAGDFGPAGPPSAGAVLDLPPPAYSEYQLQGGPQAI